MKLSSSLEITVHKPDAPTLRLRILIPTIQKIDKATR